MRLAHFAESLHLSKDLRAIAVAQLFASALLGLPLGALNKLGSFGHLITKTGCVATGAQTGRKKQLS